MKSLVAGLEHVTSTTPLTRKIQTQGFTPTHLDKHLFGSGKNSLSVIDPQGNSDIWVGYMQDLASMPVTAHLKNGVEDIIGTFPLTAGGGTFKLGIRIAPNAHGG